MPRNPNLVPTVITDVNGIVKTVHKKPQDAARGFKPAAPPLSYSARQARVRYLIDSIDELVGETSQAAIFTLSKANDQHLTLIEELFRSEDPLSTPVAGQLIEGRSIDFVAECIYLVPKLGIADYGDASSYVSAVRQYEEFRRLKDLSDIDPDTEQQVIAVITATRIIETEHTAHTDDPDYPLQYIVTGSEWGLRVIKNERLVSMIMNRTQDAEVIARIVAKHGHTEPSAIEGIMEGIIPALADGAL